MIRTMYGAGFRAAAQHSQCLYSVFTHIPGLKVVTPATPYDAKGLLIQSIRDNDPVIFCEHKMLYTLEGDVPEEAYTIPFGEANITREGDDVSIVTLGRMVHVAEEAAVALAKDGISCEIVDLRTTSPMDTDTIIESVENTGRLVVLDESSPRCKHCHRRLGAGQPGGVRFPESADPHGHRAARAGAVRRQSGRPLHPGCRDRFSRRCVR